VGFEFQQRPLDLLVASSVDWDQVALVSERGLLMLFRHQSFYALDADDVVPFGRRVAAHDAVPVRAGDGELARAERGLLDLDARAGASRTFVVTDPANPLDVSATATFPAASH
jgi:hypothetical protein